MSKVMKEYITDELVQAFADMDNFVLVDYMGISSEEAGKLRNVFREKNLKMKVVKNSLLVRALRRSGQYSDADDLSGPTAVVYGEGGAISVSRAIMEWNKKNHEIPLKGGLLEGKKGNAEEAKAWASLPSKPEILSQLLGSLLAPARDVASLMHASLSAFPSLVNAHVKKLEEESGEPEGQSSQ